MTPHNQINSNPNHTIFSINETQSVSEFNKLDPSKVPCFYFTCHRPSLSPIRFNFYMSFNRFLVVSIRSSRDI